MKSKSYYEIDRGGMGFPKPSARWTQHEKIDPIRACVPRFRLSIGLPHWSGTNSTTFHLYDRHISVSENDSHGPIQLELALDYIGLYFRLVACT